MSTALKLAMELRGKLGDIAEAFAYYGSSGHRVDVYKIMEELGESEYNANKLVEMLQDIL